MRERENERERKKERGDNFAKYFTNLHFNNKMNIKRNGGFYNLRISNDCFFKKKKSKCQSIANNS